MPTKKPHSVNVFERDILAYIDRRKGQVVDDEFLEKFAPYFWRKMLDFELKTMRDMAKALNRQDLKQH